MIQIDYELKGNGHTSGVTAICLHRDDTLYTSGEDFRIVEWSLTTSKEVRGWKIGTVKPTSILSLPTTNRLLVGCKELQLWSLDNKTKECTFTGHATDVNSMTSLLVNRNDDVETEFALTTAKQNREISLWAMKKKKRNEAHASFLMEYPATFVSCSVVGRAITVAAVTGATSTAVGGVVHLFIVEDIL